MRPVRSIFAGKGAGCELLRGGAESFLLNVIGKLLVFSAQVLLARLLSAAGYGVYSYVVALITNLALLGQFGLHNVVLRFTAAYKATQDWGRLRGILLIANKLAFAGSLIVTMLAEGVVWLLGNRLEPVLKSALFLGLPLIPLVVLSGLRQHALRGLKCIIASRLPETVLAPLVLIFGLLIVKFGFKPSVSSAILIEMASIGVSFTAGGWLLFRALPPVVKKSAPSYNIREVSATSLHLFLVVSAQQLMSNTDVVILGWFRDMTEVGIYNAVLKLGSFIAFGLGALATIAAPMVSESYAGGDRKKLEKVVAYVSLFSTVFALLVAAVCLFWGERLLGTFGEHFSRGLHPLWASIFGKVVNSIAGPVGLLLMMTGHEKNFLKVISCSALLNLLLNLVLIPRYGMMGAALASMSSEIVWNVWTGIVVVRIIKINPTFLAGFPAFGWLKN